LNSTLGKLPTVTGYQAEMGIVNADGPAIYRYMNFDQIEEYADVAKR
jgi:aconitate hydratase 2/2-methylisocitrate dehydratase